MSMILVKSQVRWRNQYIQCQKCESTWRRIQSILGKGPIYTTKEYYPPERLSLQKRESSIINLDFLSWRPREKADLHSFSKKEDQSESLILHKHVRD